LAPALAQMAEPRRSDAIAMAGTIRARPRHVRGVRSRRPRSQRQSRKGRGVRRNFKSFRSRRCSRSCNFKGRPAPVSRRAAVSRSRFVSRRAHRFRAEQRAADEFRLGRYLAEEGVVSQTRRQHPSDKSGPRKLLGESLVASGLITEDDLRRAHSSNQRAYLRSARWPDGRFSFSNTTPEASEQTGSGYRWRRS
jgi:hypothetical protein